MVHDQMAANELGQLVEERDALAEEVAVLRMAKGMVPDNDGGQRRAHWKCRWHGGWGPEGWGRCGRWGE